MDTSYGVSHGDVMIQHYDSPEADADEREFVEKCKAWHLELLNAKNEQPAPMPQYERP